MKELDLTAICHCRSRMFQFCNCQLLMISQIVRKLIFPMVNGEGHPFSTLNNAKVNFLFTCAKRHRKKVFHCFSSEVSPRKSVACLTVPTNKLSHSQEKSNFPHFCSFHVRNMNFFERPFSSWSNHYYW